LSRGLNGGEFAGFETLEKILLDVADAGFDPSLLVAAADIAGCDREAVVTGKIDIPRIEDGSRAGQTLKDGRFKVVDLMCPPALCGGSLLCL